MPSPLVALARRTLSPVRRSAAKRHLARAERRVRPLRRRLYGAFSADDLRWELERRLPQDFEILMVHCSMNNLEPMYDDGVRDLLDALVELCRPDRTLVMPAFTFGPGGDLTGRYRQRPEFDVARQPSEMGLLSEVFRRRAGVRRSLHPAASVCALGPLAEVLTEGHHRASTVFGAGTPFAAMAARRTAIVGIGTHYYRHLTQIHTAEDLLGPRFPLDPRPERIPVTLKDAHGECHGYSLPVAVPGQAWDLDRLRMLLGPNEVVQWRFHGVPMYIADAGRVTQALIEAANRNETIFDAFPARSNGWHTKFLGRRGRR
jgi:aminoglycoside 3-N-acetyltransferase